MIPPEEEHYMEAARGTVFRFGDNVDTDVIIPARYLATSEPSELAAHCMEDAEQAVKDKISIGIITTAIAFFIFIGLKLKSTLKEIIKIINNIKIPPQLSSILQIPS